MQTVLGKGKKGLAGAHKSFLQVGQMQQVVSGARLPMDSKFQCKGLLQDKGERAMCISCGRYFLFPGTPREDVEFRVKAKSGNHTIIIPGEQALAAPEQGWGRVEGKDMRAHWSQIPAGTGESQETVDYRARTKQGGGGGRPGVGDRKAKAEEKPP